MTLILSLIVLSLMFVSLFLLMMIDKSSRSGQLRQCADQLQLSYQPFASLSSQMRDARFQIIEIGQFRNFRHLLEGEYGVEGNKRQLNLFDYSLVSQEGTANQTLLLVECALPFQPLRLQQKQWLRADVFSGTTTDTLSQLQSGQLHPEMRQWQVFSKRPGEIAQILSVEVRQWLLAHPHLHIEWSNGILLLYRPRHLLDEHSIEPAINAGCELAQLLQNNASTIQ